MKEGENITYSRRDFLKTITLGTAAIGLTQLEKVFKLEEQDVHLNERDISRLLKNNLEIRNSIDTPPSLMLHSANEAQIAKLAPILAEKYSSYTYREFYALLAKGHNFNTEKPPLLISIDDPGTSWLNPAYKRMIDSMSKHGLVGTLGVVTTGEQKDVPQDIWNYFIEIQKQGCEIAIHTEDHFVLPNLSDEQIKYEITECYKNIGEGTGVYPSTLILPFGLVSAIDKLDQPDQYRKQIFDTCRDLNIRFIAGIPYGKTFSGEPPYFVGRIPPHKDDISITQSWLENSFIQTGPRTIFQNILPDRHGNRNHNKKTSR